MKAPVSDSGQTIRADYRENGTVTLTFTDGTTKVLSRAVSASGARYVSGSDEWWEYQGEATYSVNGKQMFLGKLKAKPGAWLDMAREAGATVLKA